MSPNVLNAVRCAQSSDCTLEVGLFTIGTPLNKMYGYNHPHLGVPCKAYINNHVGEQYQLEGFEARSQYPMDVRWTKQLEGDVLQCFLLLAFRYCDLPGKVCAIQTLQVGTGTPYCIAVCCGSFRNTEMDA